MFQWEGWCHGWGRAVFGVVSAYKYHSVGVPTLSLSSHSLCVFKSLLIQSVFHNFHHLWLHFFNLHSSLRVLYASFFLFGAHTHTYTHKHESICFNFSFPVWGVYPIPCSHARRTSNIFYWESEKKSKKKRKKKEKKENALKSFKWEGTMADRDVTGRGLALCLCRQ